MSQLFASGAIVLLFLSCCSLSSFLGDKSKEIVATVPGQSADQNAKLYENLTLDKAPPNTTAAELGLWNIITKNNVEQACLAVVKNEAGKNDWAVKGCSCNEKLATWKKEYECNVATFDPTKKYYINADCLLETKNCTLNSNYGNVTLTFDQIASYLK